MARVLGYQSGYLERKGRANRIASRIALAMGGIIFIVASVHALRLGGWRLSPDAQFWITFLSSLAYAGGLTYALQRHDAYLKSSFKYQSGERGEAAVFHELKSRLPDSFTIFTDLRRPSGGGNIDFIVAGPTGVYVIEVKNIRGHITFMGKAIRADGKPLEFDAFGQTVRNARGIKNILQDRALPGQYIHAVLVFAHPASVVRLGFAPLAGVYIVGLPALINVIMNQLTLPAEFSLGAVENALAGLV